MKLRLLLFEKCNRNCKGCCNNDWDLKNLEVETDYTQYDEILLTGGEPMLYPSIVHEAINDIRKQTNSPIYMYTAKVGNIAKLFSILKKINGITVTLHERKDILDLKVLDSFLKNPAILLYDNLPDIDNLSFQLNIFKGVDLDDFLPKIKIDTNRWKIKKDIVWIKNCPLPKGEVFKRYKHII